MIRFINGYTSSIPLNHPRIAYENYVNSAAGTDGQTYNPDVLVNEYTYNRWDPSGGGEANFDFDLNRPVNYIAIAAHTLKGFDVTLEYSTIDQSPFYSSIYSGTETSDTPLIFVFPEINFQYLRLTITGGEVGVLYAGRILELYRGIYSGHTPITMSRNTVKNLNRSVKGQFLGTSIVRTGLSASFQVSNIPIDWYETNIEPLSQHARTKPIFVAWNPLEHPTHTAYGYAQGDIKPALSGTINFVDFSFDLDGYA